MTRETWRRDHQTAAALVDAEINFHECTHIYCTFFADNDSLQGTRYAWFQWRENLDFKLLLQGLEPAATTGRLLLQSPCTQACEWCKYAAPSGAFSSLKSALEKEDVCRHRPTNQQAEKEKRQNEIAQPDCKILTTSNPQNKLVYRTTRYVYISDLMCITGGGGGGGRYMQFRSRLAENN